MNIAHKKGSPPFRVDVTTLFKCGFVSSITLLKKGRSPLLKDYLKGGKGGPLSKGGCMFTKYTLAHISVE